MSTSPPITANSVDVSRSSLVEQLSDHSIDEYLLLQNPLVNQEFHEGEQVNGSSPPVVVQTVERVITPIQPPLQSASSLRSQTTIGLSAPSAATFPVLRATTFQLALGHPLAYVRALMQVSTVVDRPVKICIGLSVLDGLRTFTSLPSKESLWQRSGVLSKCISIPLVEVVRACCSSTTSRVCI